MADLPEAPYLVMGLPVWREIDGHQRDQTRYNVSRVYDPDGTLSSQTSAGPDAGRRARQAGLDQLLDGLEFAAPPDAS